MKKERYGFAAFDKESGKGLNVVFGFSTCTYLTDDPDKVHLAESKKQLEMYCNWYNNSHKNKKEFEIIEVMLSTEIKQVWRTIKNETENV
jgi:hypothetical protein